MLHDCLSVFRKLENIIQFRVKTIDRGKRLDMPILIHLKCVNVCFFQMKKNFNVFLPVDFLFIIQTFFFLVSGEIPEGVGDGRTENQDSNRGRFAA